MLSFNWGIINFTEESKLNITRWDYKVRKIA